MFTPIHLLPFYASANIAKYKDRWQTHEGDSLRETILQKIRAGAGEDFLQWDFEHGQLGFLEHMHDLCGLSIFKEDITFPDGDNFEAIDFSHADFHHSNFKHACFPVTRFDFVKIYNCEFVDCVFAFSNFYGASLEKVKFINCDFFEHNSITNCALKDVEFKNCFIPDILFSDCSFDENTHVDELPADPVRLKKGSQVLDKKKLSGIYHGIKEGYAAGGCTEKYHHYLFRQRQASTRYNSRNKLQILTGLFWEMTAGYGIRPFRVIGSMIFVFLASLIWFSTNVGFTDGFLLSSGAFFTFGAKADLLGSLRMCDKAIYVLTSFLGISFTALFVTVLANVFLNRK